MMAKFCKKSFVGSGFTVITMTLTDGRTFTSDFGKAAWNWLQNKSWSSVVVYDKWFNQSYGWDRV